MRVSYIEDLVTFRLAKHLTLVITGNIFAAFLGFIALLVISKGLSVSNFGLFNIAISAMLIASSFSGLGMYTDLDSTNKCKSQELRATFFVRTIISSILVVIILRALSHTPL